MGNVKKYPEYIMCYLRKRWGLDGQDTSMDHIFNKLNPNHVLSEVFIWNGLLGGWDHQIKKWIKDIYGIDIDEESEKRNG